MGLTAAAAGEGVGLGGGMTRSSSGGWCRGRCGPGLSLSTTEIGAVHRRLGGGGVAVGWKCWYGRCWCWRW